MSTDDKKITPENPDNPNDDDNDNDQESRSTDQRSKGWRPSRF